MEMSKPAKQPLVFLSSKSPFCDSATACLDACMTAAVFDVPVHLVLYADGVLQLLANQDGSALGNQTLAKQFGALGLYGISTIYVDQQSLTERGVAQNDLLALSDADVAEIPLQIAYIDSVQIAGLISDSKAVFNF